MYIPQKEAAPETYGVCVTLEVEDKKLNDILSRLDEAREEIYKCYSELSDLGIVKLVKEGE